MTKRKTEAAAGSPSKKRRENKLTNYYGPPVQTASHVGLQSFRVDDATTSAPKEVYLSEDQIQVYKAAVHDRKSIFFTGPAGTFPRRPHPHRRQSTSRPSHARPTGVDEQAPASLSSPKPSSPASRASIRAIRTPSPSPPAPA